MLKQNVFAESFNHHGILVLSTVASERPEDLLWSPVAEEWYHSIYHTATWRLQYQKIYALAEFKEEELKVSNLKTWDVAYRGKGRPKKVIILDPFC